MEDGDFHFINKIDNSNSTDNKKQVNLQNLAFAIAGNAQPTPSLLHWLNSLELLWLLWNQMRLCMCVALMYVKTHPLITISHMSAHTLVKNNKNNTFDLL